MILFSHKLNLILAIAIVLAVSPLCGAYSSCQKVGQFCGSPPSEMFPACCPFDTSTDGEQVPLKCKNVQDGVGSCEEGENSEEPQAEAEE